MTYNIHPIFVHFPIALLVLYSILKVVPFKRWLPNVAWRDIQRVALIVGVLGAFAALATGDAAEELVRPNHQLVEAHSTFAGAATWMYVALLLGEIAAFFNARKPLFFERSAWLAKLSRGLETALCNAWVSGALALIALVTISVAGLLGGVIAYGVSADPFASTLIDWLGITL